MFALAALGPEDQDEDEDHPGDLRFLPFKLCSTPPRLSSSLRQSSHDGFQNRVTIDQQSKNLWASSKVFLSLIKGKRSMNSMRRLITTTGTTATTYLKPSVLSSMSASCPVSTALLKLTSLKLFSTGAVQIPEPPNPPDPPDSSRHGSVSLHCHGWLPCNGEVSKPQSLYPPPMYVVAISAGREIKISMNFKHQFLCVADPIDHVLGMVTLVFPLFSEKVIFVYSDVTDRPSTTIPTFESQFSGFSNPVIFAYSGDMERSSTTLSTFESQFSGFSNPATLTTWLRSEFIHFYVILMNTFASYIGSLYVLAYIPRVFLLSFEWCCYQRTCLRLMKVFPISLSRNPSSFMDRGMLSSASRIWPLTFTVVALFLRAILLGLKKVYFKAISRQNSTFQSLVDWDLFVCLLNGESVLDNASDKAYCVLNLFLDVHVFGSLLILKDVTSLMFMTFELIMLLYFYLFSFLAMFVMLNPSGLDWSVT